MEMRLLHLLILQINSTKFQSALLVTTHPYTLLQSKLIPMEMIIVEKLVLESLPILASMPILRNAILTILENTNAI